jgi:voltage-gated potassium channel
MQKKLRHTLYKIIFESDTPPGKLFDIVLLIIIVLNVVTVMCESVPLIRRNYAIYFIILEWIFTSIFTLEYFIRIYSAPKRWDYMFSFYGIIDFLASIPVYLGFFIGGARSLLIIRTLRLLRVFRVFKVSRVLNAGDTLMKALKSSKEKIGIFLFTVLMVVILIGTLMYLIEGEESGFTSIPKSIYWAIVTLTTVGYGDLTPHTSIGQFFSAILMITGYAIIAVPTGIITVELARRDFHEHKTLVCPECGKGGHDPDARYCKYCGAGLKKQKLV